MKQIDSKGIKYDEGKLRYDLMPPHAFQEVVKVLTHGAKKYDDENWRLVPEYRRRYYAAMMRHVEPWRMGKDIDESGCHHIACAIASLLFILERELTNVSKNT